MRRAQLRRMVRADPVPPSAAHRTPLFRHADGSGFSCRFFRGLLREPDDDVYGFPYPRGWFDLSVISADET